MKRFFAWIMVFVLIMSSVGFNRGVVITNAEGSSSGDVSGVASTEATIVASGQCGNCFYTIDDKGVCTISGTSEIGKPSNGWSDNIVSIVISDGVTSIGRIAFWQCTNLKSVTIPNSVTSIGIDAFADCSNLKSVSIPSSVTSIGEGAFYYCSSLTSITIPGSVTSIGTAAFAHCDNLTSIKVHEDNKLYSDCNSNIIVDISDSSSMVLISGCKSSIIPNTVTSIGKSAFRGSGIKSITIPSSVTSIGDSAFEGCTSLTSITIPSSVTDIEDYAFWGCENLTSVKFMNRKIKIGSMVFYGSGIKSLPCWLKYEELDYSHNYGNWTYDEYYSSKSRTCKDCGEIETIEHEHTLEDYEIVEYSEIYDRVMHHNVGKCKECGYIDEDYYKNIYGEYEDHDIVYKGNKKHHIKYYRCCNYYQVCDKTKVKKYKIIRKASINQDGIIKYTCKCGYTWKETFNLKQALKATRDEFDCECETDYLKYKRIYQNSSKKITVTISKTAPGAVIKLKINGKTYTQKVKGKKKKFVFNTCGATYGKKVSVKLCYKGLKVDSYNTRVYYGNNISTGMSKKVVQYVYGWNSPSIINKYSGGYEFWHYRGGRYIMFKNGVVYKWRS